MMQSSLQAASSSSTTSTRVTERRGGITLSATLSRSVGRTSSRLGILNVRLTSTRPNWSTCDSCRRNEMHRRSSSLQYPRPSLFDEAAFITPQGRPLRVHMNNFRLSHVRFAMARQIDIHNRIERQFRGAGAQKPAQTHVLSCRELTELLTA